MGGVESVAQDVGNAFEDLGNSIADGFTGAVDGISGALDIAGEALLDIPRKLIEILHSPSRPIPIPVPLQVATGKTDAMLIAEAKEALGLDPDCYNFAFSGNSGSGKSSLINALRGVEDSSPDAAKVDEVECTSEITKYVHPNNPHVVLWDLPGGGTQSHKSHDYFEQKKLYVFDCIIVISGTFTELDIHIATSANRLEVPLVLVRSKSDAAIDSRAYRLKKPRVDVKEGAKQAIIAKMREELPENLQESPMFVISSRVIGGAYEGFNPEDYRLDEAAFVEHVLRAAEARRAN